MKRVLLATVLLVGCHKTATIDPTPAPPATSASSAPAAATASSASSATRAVSPPPLASSRTERESAVAEVAFGGIASALPERSTDPAHSFDDRLRDKLVPKKTPPTLKQSKVEVTAGLPREVVMRVLRARWPAFRACYEKGLATKPDLAGTFAVTFSIERDGTVKNPKNAGSTIGDANVVSCVTRSIEGLSFPQPESAAGTRVTYEIELEPPK